MVHHLLKSLAERAPTNSRGTLHIWEGELPDAGHHPVLLHHGVGDFGHLLQVVLGSCMEETRRLPALSGVQEKQVLHKHTFD